MLTRSYDSALSDGASKEISVQGSKQGCRCLRNSKQLSEKLARLTSLRLLKWTPMPNFVFCKKGSVIEHPLSLESLRA